MREPTDRREPAAKAAYHQPALVHYGSIAKLTQTNNGSGADGGTMAAMHHT